MVSVYQARVSGGALTPIGRGAPMPNFTAPVTSAVRRSGRKPYVRPLKYALSSAAAPGNSGRGSANPLVPGAAVVASFGVLA